MSRSRVSMTGMTKNPNYHHGDLRNQLIAESLDLLREQGLEGFSLRKLAERAGVSRTAPYHHFKDKKDLLASIAEQGFDAVAEQLSCTEHTRGETSLTLFERTMTTYIDFALDNVVQYDLMFGRELWRKQPSERLQRKAKDCFRVYAQVIEGFQQAGVLIKEDEPLRMAQVLWSTMHGLVKLAHDGIFVRKEDLREISKYALSKYCT